MSTRFDRVWVDDVVVRGRKRPLNPNRVDSLADSMGTIGLQTPISVYTNETDTILVAGNHRLEAAKKLGWEWIDCQYIRLDETSREMWEIAENLHRCDLTKDQRDEHIRRYAELLEQKKTIVPQNAEQLPQKRGRPKSITTQIAEDTGLSDDTVRRALNPTPKVTEIKSDEEIATEQFNSLVRLWNRSSPRARELFEEFLA